MQKKPKIVSFFAGIGGIDLGFRQAGFEVAAAYEIDKFAVQTYLYNVGSEVVQQDIKNLTWENLPESDVWTFGFPCQDLSLAGQRRGMKMYCEDCKEEMDYQEYVEIRQCGSCQSKQIRPATRSGLFFEIMRLLDECKIHAPEKLPKVLLAENVKPLKTYLPQLEEEFKLRHFSMQAQLFNSKFWGVPQNRERYYVVGVHKSLRKDFDFPKQQSDFIPKLSSVLDPFVDEKYYISDEKAAKIIEQALKRLPKLEEIHACLTPERIHKRQNGPRAKENEAPSFTITTQDHHGVIKKEVVGVLVSGKSGLREVEQSCTLDACYYKGLGSNQNRIGVLEILTDVWCLTEQRTEEAKQIRREYRQKYGIDFCPRRGKEVAPRTDDVANCITATQSIEQQLLEQRIEIIPIQILSSNDVLHVTEQLQSLWTTKDGVSYAIDAHYSKGTSPHEVEKGKSRSTQVIEPSIHIVGMLGDEGFESIRRVYGIDGIAPTLTTMQGGNQQPKVLVVEPVKKTEGCEGNLLFVGGISSEKWLDDGKEFSRNFKQGYRVYSVQGIGAALTARGGGLGGSSGLYLVAVGARYRVRKLTPTECGRLQGFPMEAWEQVVSDSQAYKQFGNSVTVPLVKAIAEQIKICCFS
ncbi:DNA cytosine methyltransferase [Neobacillus sp. YIM B02564]|uniref:DNA (cytosine-5-)-methyltransferase n=1 Tax=Neobacillus paridis TaxID=2803862 RepID=A0ABS1TQJ6_9BACI|nr:DNA cytosine methyltransferase [Neobacillus paridis]MBL4952170.1 DNA cytosine methyltransferase [Neobacillus paridis]